jgi:hypothetical protein
MKKINRFCKECLDKPEKEYFRMFPIKTFWENGIGGHSDYSCSKCGKKFRIGDVMFISRNKDQRSTD